MDTHPPNYQFDNVEVRPRSFEVVKAGAAVSLEPKSIRVLLHLIENRDRAVSKEELFQTVWPDTTVSDNALTRVIAQLRRELGDDAREPRYIQTIPTLGYRFVGAVRLIGNGASRPAEKTSSLRVSLVAVGLMLPAMTVGAYLVYHGRYSTPSKAQTEHELVQLTTSAGFDTSPTFSPNADSLAYCSDRTGRFEVYVRPLHGAIQETQLTTDGAQNVQPAWSPDGKSIAYHSAAKGGIWIIPSSGGLARQLTAMGSQPAWSPDSRRIAYRSENVFSLAPTDLISPGKSAIYVVAASGGAPQRVTNASNANGSHVFPSWSPDGTRILFAAYSEKTAELWTTRVDGSSARKIAALASAVFLSPVWGPDGSRIFYGSYSRAHDFGLWQVRLKAGGDEADGEPVRLKSTGTVIPRDLAVSRDGKRLAYSSSNTSSTLWRLNMDNEAHAAGEPSPLYKDVVWRTSYSSFSPDGQRIAFFARLFGGQGNVWVMSADGAGATQLTNGLDMAMSPTWTPDGSAIVYTRRTGNGTQVWRTSIADRSDKLLLEDPALLAWPRLSPDGAEIAYHRDDARFANIWRMNLASHESKQLTHEAEGAGYPAWSPDGRLLAYEVTRGANAYVAIMDHDGGHQTQLQSDPVLNWSFSWSPDGRKIAFAGFREGAWNIWWIDRLTREQKKLTSYDSLAGFVRYPSWSPQGDRIVFENSVTRGNIYVFDLK